MAASLTLKTVKNGFRDTTDAIVTIAKRRTAAGG
jgi:hypothetical protein